MPTGSRPPTPNTDMDDGRRTPPMLPTQELAVRVLVLCVYIVAAVGVAWIHREALAAVIHLTGAVAALCAVSLAVTYAGLVGEASPGPVEDQARDYMERTEWDD